MKINLQDLSTSIAEIYSGCPRTTENENFLFEEVYQAIKNEGYDSTNMNELYRMAWEQVKWSKV